MKERYGNVRLPLFLGFVLGAGLLSAQEPILNSYQRNFIRADLAGKAEVLRDAATDERAPEFMGALYDFALRFSLQNAGIFRDDSDMIALTALAAAGAGRTGHTASADTLWEIFLNYRDSLTRVEALNALAALGQQGEDFAAAGLTGNLNQFLIHQNNLYRSGIEPDYPVLSACIAALGVLGDAGTYPVLFTALVSNYPASITRDITRALDSIRGDYDQFLLGVLRNNPPMEKLAAFRAGAHNTGFTDARRGELAETALKTGLEFLAANAESAAAVSELRYQAAAVLTELKWTRATDLAVRHFYQVQTDYGNGSVSKELFLSAITCLGAMGSSGAAQVLALQLGYLNSRMERDGSFDEAVILGVVNALGEIGDKAAFDSLLYISYLNYPEQIQTAARNALNRLKW
jgi:HEAT repeat protein